MKTVILALFSLPFLVCAQEAPEKPDAPREEKPRKESSEEHKKHHEGGDGHERLARMKREIGELQRAGKHDAAERLAKELHAAAQHHHPQAAEKGHRPMAKERPAAAGPERLRHLQEAINHLRAAGMDEPARDLASAAEKMRDQLERHSHAGPGRPEGDANPMREMHRQLQEMREQMQKMSQELQALREHTRRDRADDRR